MNGLASLALAPAALLAWGGWGLPVEPAVEQPLRFPHEAHLALKEPELEVGGYTRPFRL